MRGRLDGDRIPDSLTPHPTNTDARRGLASLRQQWPAGVPPEAALCSKISPNATFVDEGDAIALLQSRCYLGIASNTRDIRLCDPLPAAGSFPHINEIYNS